MPKKLSGKRMIEEYLGPCLNKAIKSCARDPLMIFPGCLETTQLAAWAADALGLEFMVLQGKVRTWDGKVVDHVWVELPELGLRIETNASQVMGIPVFVIVLDLSYGADRYMDAFENMGILSRVTKKGEEFYGRMAKDVAACVWSRR